MMIATGEYLKQIANKKGKHIFNGNLRGQKWARKKVEK